MKTSIIIPAYNEIDTIAEVLDKVIAVDIDKEIIVADDCSTDGTREYLRNRDDIILVENENNMGKGMSIRKAISVSSGDIIFIQDADLEYFPNQIPQIIKPIEEDKADLVYGSRFLNKRPQMRLPNFIANKVFAFLATILYGYKVTDEATCYKAFRASVLKSIDLKCKRFEFCPEVTARLLKRKYRYLEIPIDYTPRTYAQGKKITAKDGIECIWTLFKYRFFG